MVRPQGRSGMDSADPLLYLNMGCHHAALSFSDSPMYTLSPHQCPPKKFGGIIGGINKNKKYYIHILHIVIHNY